ncbi:hypothetical protein V1280_000379 [Bradyrhizobium sp. AZCC 2230]
MHGGDDAPLISLALQNVVHETAKPAAVAGHDDMIQMRIVAQRRLLVAARMALALRHHEFFLEQRLMRKALGEHGLRDQRDIDVACLQLAHERDGINRAQRQPHPGRVSPAQPLNQPRADDGAGIVVGAERERAL